MTIVWAVIIFSLLIFIHELGHFIAARATGVSVLEFAIGMGPAFFSTRRGNTKYSLRIFPIGGYCKMEGEDERSDEQGAFSSKPPASRLCILLAGAVMNIILGFVIFVIITLLQGGVITPQINKLMPDSGAQAAGMMPGDRIIRLNDTQIHLKEDLDFFMARNGDKPIDVTFVRDNVKNTVSVTPTDTEKGYKIGFEMQVEGLTAGSLLHRSFYYTIFIVKLVVVSLADLVLGNMPLNQLSGPVGIVKEIGTAARSGILELLWLAAAITINLGVMNLLPLPALDGGRIVFVLWEWVTRRPLKPEYEGMVHFVGLLLLLLAMVAVTWSDITKLLGF